MVLSASKLFTHAIHTNINQYISKQLRIDT